MGIAFLIFLAKHAGLIKLIKLFFLFQNWGLWMARNLQLLMLLHHRLCCSSFTLPLNLFISKVQIQQEKSVPTLQNKHILWVLEQPEMFLLVPAWLEVRKSK